MKIFSRDFFHVCLFLFLIGTMLAPACTSRKSATDLAPSMTSEKSSAVVNINTADAVTLQRIPSIGPGLAGKIIEHRIRYGPFRRIENLMLIEGVSDRRFREIRHLITVD